MTLASLHSAFAARPHHFAAFLVLGDPTPDLSVELARAAVQNGATMLELGMPYSDPCADGPAIQAACDRSRAAGVSTPQAIDVLARISAALPDVPKNLLVYGNLVHAPGYRAFCERVVGAGASSLLVPDIPLEESGPLRAACRETGLGEVQLVGPGTDPERLREIDSAVDAFLYLAGLQGVTGAVQDDDAKFALLERVRDQVERPICLGFGLSTPEHVRRTFAAGGRIAVVGSQLARVIDAAWQGGAGDPAKIVDVFGEACRMLSAPAT